MEVGSLGREGQGSYVHSTLVVPSFSVVDTGGVPSFPLSPYGSGLRRRTCVEERNDTGLESL